MIEHPTEIRRSVGVVREGKDLAKAFDVNMKSQRGKELNGIIDDAHLTLVALEDQYQHFITDKFTKLEGYIGISYDELRDRHAYGFEKFLKQQYRLYKSEQPSEISILHDKEHVRDLAIGYTFDYLRTLTLGKKMGVTPGIALKLAELSHWNDPNILISLSIKFPEVDPGFIKYAATRYPSNPESYIQSTVETIERLKKDHPTTEIGLIKTAIHRRQEDPDSYIKEAEDLIPILLKKFPDVDSNIVKTAAKSYLKDPEKHIERVQKLIDQLKGEFSGVSEAIIKHAAAHHLRSPRDYIHRLQQSSEKLKLLFPDVNDGVIYRAAIHYPTNPEGYVRSYLKTLSELQNEHPTRPPWFLNHVAAGYARNPNPEEFIDAYDKRLDSLRAKYNNGDVSDDKLQHAALAKDAEGYLNLLLFGRTYDEDEELEFEDIEELVESV